MRVLIDENLPQKLRHWLVDHEVSTVAYAGWSGLKNGDLLQAAESRNFEVLVTGDQSLRYQQNLKSRRMSLVILSAIQWEILKNHLPEIIAAVNGCIPGSFREVDCGTFDRKQNGDDLLM